MTGGGSEKKCLNSELWHACAGPLVSLPTPGTRVVYFPQGHSEQVLSFFTFSHVNLFLFNTKAKFCNHQWFWELVSLYYTWVNKWNGICLGCCHNKQRSWWAHTELSKLGCPVVLSTPQCHNACRFYGFTLSIQDTKNHIVLLIGLVIHEIAGRCWNRWSICAADLTTFNTGRVFFSFVVLNKIFHGFELFTHSVLNGLSFFNGIYSKSRRIHFFRWNWEFQASSQQTTFARHWQRVTPAHMEVFPSLVVQLRKFFLRW